MRVRLFATIRRRLWYIYFHDICFYVIKIQKNEEEEELMVLWPHELIT